MFLLPKPGFLAAKPQNIEQKYGMIKLRGTAGMH